MKNVFFSACALLIPLIPVIAYDFSHEFKQTILFFLWIPYKAIMFISLLLVRDTNAHGFIDMIYYYQFYYKRLIFPFSGIIVSLLALLTFVFIFKHRKLKANIVIILLCFLFPLIGFFLNKTPSEAYIPLFFPTVVLLTVSSLDNFFRKGKKYLFFIILLLVCIGNIYFLFTNNFLIDIKDGYGVSFSKRLSMAKIITEQANGEKYNLVGKGEGSQHASFVMGYDYLLWWLGNAPSKEKQEKEFIILDPDINPTLQIISRNKQ